MCLSPDGSEEGEVSEVGQNRTSTIPHGGGIDEVGGESAEVEEATFDFSRSQVNIGISGKGRFSETDEGVTSSATQSRSRVMAWKLIEVTGEDDETLSDAELIGVQIALASAARNSAFGVGSPFVRILTKLAAQLTKAFQQDQEQDDDLEKPKEN
jgi:hypothetical protein